MRIKNLDIGLEQISRWRIDDEFHLPDEGRAGSVFLPQHRPLDEVLRRPSLDERLPDLLQPSDIDPELLAPNVLTDMRKSLMRAFSERAAGTQGEANAIFSAAAALLASDDTMDEEVRTALAVLLRG